MGIAMKPSQIIRAGAAYIREHGWRQDPWCHDKRRCIIMALPECRRSDGVIDKLCEVAGTNRSVVLLGRWNDAPGRTVTEVLAVMDRAAGELEGEGK